MQSQIGTRAGEIARNSFTVEPKETYFRNSNGRWIFKRILINRLLRLTLDCFFCRKIPTSTGLRGYIYLSSLKRENVYSRGWRRMEAQNTMRFNRRSPRKR